MLQCSIDVLSGGVGKMTEISSSKSKRKVERYAKNPFVEGALVNTKVGVRKIIDQRGEKMMIVSQETGEIVAPAGFWQMQEVDKSQFVKLYVNGVKAFRELTGAGTKVFEILYLRMQDRPGQDQAMMTFPSVDQGSTPMSEATFYRGMRELIEKGFLAESTVPGMYFINPDYLWNGDRLAFVKEYRVRKPAARPSAAALEAAGQQRLPMPLEGS